MNYGIVEKKKNILTGRVNVLRKSINDASCYPLNTHVFLIARFFKVPSTHLSPIKKP